MKKIYLFLLLALFVPSVTSAAISSWQKAASMVPRYSTDFGSEEYKQSVRNLKASNINTVTLIIPYYQSNCQSSDIQATGSTPTEASIISGIQYARSQGLNVSLKLHLETMFDGNCAWRANIDASDRVTWFTNYGNVLNRLGSIATAQGVSEMVIGAELIRMSSGDPNITPHAADNSARWKTMIANLRKVFPGKLTYSANWGSGGFATETNQVKFWDSLDTIGISGYYELPSSTDSVADIKTQWDKWNTNNIAPLTTAYGKSFQFTEIGYQSADGARFQPWDYNRKWWAGYDGQEQANLYEALFQYWNNYSYMNGVNLWDWSTDPNVGGTTNTDYTPNNKPAQTVITNYFSGGTTPPPGPPPPPPAVGTFTSSTTTSGSTAGQSVTVNTNVVSQAASSNLIVDLEVYNSTGQKVAQRFFEAQSFTAGQSKPYSLTFTPATAGTYKVGVGVFSSTWGTNYYWNDTATFNVSSSTIPPPPPAKATVTVTKVVVNNDGGTANVSDYALKIGNTSVVSGQSIQIDPGTYTVTETGPTGYTATFSGNCNASGSITLAANDNKTCTITNNDNPVVTPPPPPPPTGSFSAAGSATPSAPTTGQSTTVNINVVSQNAASNLIVDLEVYNSAGQRVEQRFFEAQSFTAGQSKPFSITLTPATSGSYKTAVGVFSSNWGTNHLWKDDVVTFSASTSNPTPPPPPPPPGPTPPPPTTFTINNWWPTDGSALSGVQPFKGSVDGLDVSAYTMYWQVDGGALVLMPTNMTDAPHKETLVDVNSWTWRGRGPYTITFVAKDSTGKVIARKSINVTITN